MMGLEEEDLDEAGKFVLAQIKAVKAGKPLDVKKLAPVLGGDVDSNTDMLLFKLAETARRKGDKTAKQFAGMIRAVFENHVKAIEKRAKKWPPNLLGDFMKILKVDVAFAEPLLARAMKAKTDVDFLKDLVYLAAGVDKKRAERMYNVVQEAAKTKPEWVFRMPTHKPARM